MMTTRQRTRRIRLSDTIWTPDAWRSWWPAEQDRVLADLLFVARHQPVPDRDAWTDQPRFVRFEILQAIHLVVWNGAPPRGPYVDDAPPRKAIRGFVLTQAGVELVHLATRPLVTVAGRAARRRGATHAALAVLRALADDATSIAGLAAAGIHW